MSRPFTSTASPFPIESTVRLSPKAYAVVTLHRPSNVDDRSTLMPIVETLCDPATRLPIVFPVHPRTQARLERFKLGVRLTSQKGIHCLAPQRYIRSMNLLFNCRLAITDSGGIQEETTYLGIPCITLRANTERPLTLAQGTNRLCAIQELGATVESVRYSFTHRASPPEGWDGKTAVRVADSTGRFFACDRAQKLETASKCPATERSW